MPGVITEAMPSPATSFPYYLVKFNNGRTLWAEQSDIIEAGPEWSLVNGQFFFNGTLVNENSNRQRSSFLFEMGQKVRKRLSQVTGQILYLNRDDDGKITYYVRFADRTEGWFEEAALKNAPPDPTPPPPPEKEVRTYVRLSRQSESWGISVPETEPITTTIRDHLTKEFSIVDRGSLLRIAAASEQQNQASHDLVREMKAFRKEMKEMMKFWKELREEYKRQKCDNNQNGTLNGDTH